MEDLKKYYADRAKEYEETAGYRDPVAEKIREKIKVRHQNYFRGHDVLEIACGTGYWTEVIVVSAKSILTIDINKEMITIAKKRLARFPNVNFKVADAFVLDKIQGYFSAAYAHWWWSHIPKSMIRDFLLNLHRRLIPGAFVLFADHLPGYPGREIEVIRDKNGDRLEKRVLKNGKKYLIIKNFPTQEEINMYLLGIAKNINFHEYKGYWELGYNVIKKQ